MGLAGCASDDGPEPVSDTSEDITSSPGGNQTTEETDESDTESETEETDTTESLTTAEATVGDVVRGETLAMVVRDVTRTTEIGEFQEADPGNEFVVVRMAVKNITQDTYLGFSSVFQTTLRDDEDYAYDPTFAVTDQTLASGQLVPGEVTRGDVVFEVPEGASGLAMYFDFEAFDVLDFDRVTIDLESAAASTGDLSMSLGVDVYDPGQTIEYDGLSAALNSVRRESSLGSFTEAEQGNEFLITDVSITNETGEEKSVSTLLQMVVKDGIGFSYSPSISATSQLSRGFSQGSPISEGETRRGEIAYEVPTDASALYWTFEFTLFTEGDKVFWRAD